MLLEDPDSSSSSEDDQNMFSVGRRPKCSGSVVESYLNPKVSWTNSSPSHSISEHTSSHLPKHSVDYMDADKGGVINFLGTPVDGYEDSGEGSSQPSPMASQQSNNSYAGEADFVVSKGSKSASTPISDWTIMDTGHSGDDLSGYEDNVSDDKNFERKKMYLLVARCIAYPFNAKLHIENTPLRAKLNKDRFNQMAQVLHLTLDDYDKIKQEFKLRLSKHEQEVVREELFLDCLRWMLEVVFCRPEVIEMCGKGGFSVKELEVIFSVKAVSVLSEEGGGTEVSFSDVTIWCTTFRKIVEQCSRAFLSDYGSSHISKSTATSAPNKDQLYKLFQKILKIRSMEHQILYRECQLGNLEEQEAVVRRELQTRSKVLLDPSSNLMEGGSMFGSHKVETIYREEQLKTLKHLNNNLDLLSLHGAAFGSLDRKKRKSNVSELGNIQLGKQDLNFSMKVKVTLHSLIEVQPAHKGKEVFCVFGEYLTKEQLSKRNINQISISSSKDPLQEKMLDSGKEFQTQPVEVNSTSVQLGEEGEFWVASPLPQIKFELRCIPKGIFSGSKLAKHVHTVMPSSSDISSTVSLFHSDKDVKDGIAPTAKLKISTILERPNGIKKFGYLVAVGDTMFKQRKRSFFALIQLSQYKFLLCSYQPDGVQPKERLLLDQGLTVEFTSDSKLQGDSDAKSLFDLVFDESEMGCIHFGCRDDMERQSWIEWIVRGTGQSSHPQQLGVKEIMRSGSTDLESYGLAKVVEEVNAITSLEPHKMFVKLFRITLDYRLDEDLFSRGFFSPAQMYVLDEFCARYGVRDPFRHLTCLKDWLECMEKGISIWPIMIQSSFRFCQMHVGGLNPQDKAVIVTTEERTKFVDICRRIEHVVTYQIQNFRTYFPFCCPKGDLRTTFKLFDMVATMNHSTRQVSTSTSQSVLVNMLEKAALNNYRHVYGKLDLSGVPENTPLTLNLTFELAKLCIAFMYELHNFYLEELYLTNAIHKHINAFWLFFLVDVREAIDNSNDNNVVKLQLFYVVNHYMSSEPTLKLDEFKSEFLKKFSPVVLTYIETLALTLKQELEASLLQETWLPVTNTCCTAMEGVMKSLLSFKRFLSELNWPEENFANFLEQKIAAICADCFQETAEVIQAQFLSIMSCKASLSLTFSLPLEFFTMMNTLVYLSSQVMQMCATQRIQLSQAKDPDSSSLEHAGRQSIEEHLTGILKTTISMAIDKLSTPMQSLLDRLTKFDPSEGFLASLRKIIPTSIPIEGYSSFLSNNLELINDHLVDTIFHNFVVDWYECQMQLLSLWLEKRPEFSLHSTQQSTVEEIFQVLYEMFVACKDIPPHKLKSESYDIVKDRIRIETSHTDLMQIGKS